MSEPISEHTSPPASSVKQPLPWARLLIDWVLGRPKTTAPTHVEQPQSSHRQRFVDVGWLVDTKSSAFIWDAPRPINRKLGKAEHPKSVQKCPSVLDFDKRFFVIPAPVDLHLGVARDDKGVWQVVNKAGPTSPIYKNKVNELVHLAAVNQWRHRDKPVLQISAPYRFISDEPVWMYQMPPFLHYGSYDWPGVLISGRLPIHIWPRIMMWAFEWHDTSKDLILRRGEPWFFAHFETADPNRPIRLVQATMTEALRTYCSGTDGVTNYVNQTYGLFDTAESRRPKQLLVPFEGYRPDSQSQIHD